MSGAGAFRPSRPALAVLIGLVLALAAAGPWWRQWNEGALGHALAKLARPGDLRMLSSDGCAICARARQWFDRYEVAFTECSIERDGDCAAQFRALGAPGTPVILVRGTPELGFEPQRLKNRLGG